MLLELEDHPVTVVNDGRAALDAFHRPELLVLEKDRDKVRALTAGFNHHFTKPVEPQQLLAVMRSNNQGSGGR